MSITDELRKFAWKECPSKFLERVIGIADSIDAAHQKAMDALFDAPGAIREQVVRCKDCEWFDFDICACKRRPLHMAVKPDGFCAWGERRDA